MKSPRSTYCPAVILTLLACACSPEEPKSSVWENYDVRHETQNLAEPYIDNDAYYAPPDCSVMDSPSCGGG